MVKFTYYDVGKMAYDNNDTSLINYHIHQAFVTFMDNDTDSHTDDAEAGHESRTSNC